MSTKGPSGDVPHSSLEGDQSPRLEEENFLGSESQIEGSNARQNMLLWIAVLGSAVVWFLQLQTSYSLVLYACAAGAMWSIHAASVLFLVLAAVPGWIGWQQWSAESARDGERESAGGGRRRFMALLGLMLTALFVLLIIAQAIPSFFFDPCLE